MQIVTTKKIGIITEINVINQLADITLIQLQTPQKVMWREKSPQSSMWFCFIILLETFKAPLAAEQ